MSYKIEVVVVPDGDEMASEITARSEYFIAQILGVREFFLYVPLPISLVTSTILWFSMTRLNPSGKFLYVGEVSSWAKVHFLETNLLTLEELLRYSNSVYFDAECDFYKT